MKLNKSNTEIVLNEMNFYKFVEDFSKKGYQPINYGPKIGKIRFDSLIDANNKYKINSNASEENFNGWRISLNDTNSKSEDLLITCVTIFDWGGVTASNLTKVLEMHRSNQLQSYIQFIKSFLNSEDLIISSQETEKILWSSGWTKVYSAINSKFIIYDSRVAAYLIFLLDQFYKSKYIDKKHLENFNQITSYLFTMKNLNRVRSIKTEVLHKNHISNKNLNAFNGNLVASWIIQLLCENVFINNDESQLEKAFFMLGFDLSQLEILS